MCVVLFAAAAAAAAVADADAVKVLCVGVKLLVSLSLKLNITLSLTLCTEIERKFTIISCILQLYEAFFSHLISVYYQPDLTMYH